MASLVAPDPTTNDSGDGGGGGGGSNSSDGDQIATHLGGKYFWHHKDLDLAAMSVHLPEREGRTIFGVTFFEPYLFYHDRDMVLKKSQPYVKKLFAAAESSSSGSSNNSHHGIVEILVTRNAACPSKCKFERLGNDVTSNGGGANKKNRKGSITDPTTTSTTATTTTTTTTIESVSNSDEQTNSKAAKEWTINPWLQGNQTFGKNNNEEKSKQTPTTSTEDETKPKGKDEGNQNQKKEKSKDDPLRSIFMSTLRSTLEFNKQKQQQPTRKQLDHEDENKSDSEASDSGFVVVKSRSNKKKSSSSLLGAGGSQTGSLAEVLKAPKKKINLEEKSSGVVKKSSNKAKNEIVAAAAAIATEVKRKAKAQKAMSKSKSFMDNSNSKSIEDTDRSIMIGEDFSLNCCEDLNSSSLRSLNDDESSSSAAAMTSAASLPTTAESSPLVMTSSSKKLSLVPEWRGGETSVSSVAFDESKWANTLAASRKHSIEPSLVEFFKKKSAEWADYSMNLVDSHCHFDMLFMKMNYRKPVREYFQDFKSIYLDNFEACVNILCDPKRFQFHSENRTLQYLKTFRHKKVYSTIGCHPHFSMSWNSDTTSLISRLLDTGEFVAIGECGLDNSNKNSVDKSVQIAVFESQLQIANGTKFPLVIHCRDAELEVFEMMKKSLSPDHRIHLHCFTGGWKMGKQYLDHFRNLCIGVTPLITTREPKNKMIELAMNAPLERLLLETDAPYFIPRTSEFPHKDAEFSHPAFIYATAEQLACFKRTSVDNVLKANRQNVKKVYGF